MSVVFIALAALLGSAFPLSAAESEAFTGTAARSGTYKRPLLDVDGKRYELKTVRGLLVECNYAGGDSRGEWNFAKVVDEVFVPYRPMGGKLAWIGVQGHGHQYNENRQDLLTMPLLDAAVRARYPKDGDVTKGPVKLLRIDPSTGWIADNTTWKSGLTYIVPATQFKGDLGHSSWLQTEDIAFITQFDLPESVAGKQATLSLGPIDDIDTTWVNGVRVGGGTVWNQPRVYKSTEDRTERQPAHLTGRAVALQSGRGVGGHQAGAKIDGDTVVVSSPEVAEPVAVRYGWANNPVCNLYNKTGLPASPFRTDVEDQ